jgi:hypothetical protein
MSLELILINASQPTVLSDASLPSLRWCLAPENTEPNKGFTSIKMARRHSLAGFLVNFVE